jgi:hypothetical protein
MKILSLLIKFLLFLLGLFAVTAVLVFFCVVFFRENTVFAIEFFKNLLKIP